MFRFFDLFLSLVALFALFPLLIVLYFIGLVESGSPIFTQLRVGKNKKPFLLYKFRTMTLDAPNISSHLVTKSFITPYGRFLRRTKLDELPQLINVLKGEMSFVGPRPGLFSHIELTTERDKYGVFSVRPGITGLSQVNKIDMSTPLILAKSDSKMIEDMSVFNYFKYILVTLTGKGGGDRVL